MIVDAPPQLPVTPLGRWCPSRSDGDGCDLRSPFFMSYPLQHGRLIDAWHVVFRRVILCAFIMLMVVLLRMWT